MQNPDEYVLRNTIQLPFLGSWKALNVARNASNPHFANPNQRFAVDCLKVDSAGRSYKDKGKELRDYYCYGDNALAVGDSLVVSVVDGVPEHSIKGTPDRYNVPGNHVVLDLGMGEFAFYAHLIPGQMKVRIGDRVRAAQILGKVGNSGNSTEPHLHFQIMNHARLIEAVSLPIRFADVLLNGNYVSSAELNEGDVLAPCR